MRFTQIVIFCFWLSLRSLALTKKVLLPARNTASNGQASEYWIIVPSVAPTQIISWNFEPADQCAYPDRTSGSSSDSHEDFDFDEQWRFPMANPICDLGDVSPVTPRILQISTYISRNGAIDAELPSVKSSIPWCYHLSTDINPAAPYMLKQAEIRARGRMIRIKHEYNTKKIAVHFRWGGRGAKEPQLVHVETEHGPRPAIEGDFRFGGDLEDFYYRRIATKKQVLKMI